MSCYGLLAFSGDDPATVLVLCVPLSVMIDDDVSVDRLDFVCHCRHRLINSPVRIGIFHRTPANRQKPSKNQSRKYFKHDGITTMVRCRDGSSALHIIDARNFPYTGLLYTYKGIDWWKKNLDTMILSEESQIFRYGRDSFSPWYIATEVKGAGH
jgi:hypothetical protein